MTGARLPHVAMGSPLWLWVSKSAPAIVSTGNVGEIIKAYRAATRTTQAALASAMQYDKSYITMLESGRRSITDVSTLRRLAEHLGVPPHVFGVADAEAADFTMMIKFGQSTIRLAGVAREAGHAAEAINELWPLVWRLESRVADGSADRAVARLLGEARAVLGVALGDILPEENLAAAARWTGRALYIADLLDDGDLLSRALRVHGNELRKIGRTAAASIRLQHAADLASPTEQAAILVPLARALAELGDAAWFDATVSDLHRFVDERPTTPLVNPFVVREVRLRGLLATGRARDALRLAEADSPAIADVAPQWRAIERVTVAEVFSTCGDGAAAENALRQSINTAEALHLPHQIQRAMRAARRRFPEVEAAGADALGRLQRRVKAD